MTDVKHIGYFIIILNIFLSWMVPQQFIAHIL